LQDWGGRIVIDVNNPIEAPLFKPVNLKGRVSSEVLADFVLTDRIGFVGIDLGSFAVGGKLAQFPGGPLPNQDLVKMD
jgi:predicted dinucleotide-binding enzyme